MHYDTIIIGAGLAGLSAALRRAALGERVLVLAKGYGASGWTAGCVDVWAAGDAPLSALATLVRSRPQHPYALVGLEALQRGLEWVRTLAAAAGYPLVGGWERGLRLPTALGALRSTCLVPLTMVAGESRQLADGPLLIAGLRELRDFFPPLIAENLRAQGYAATGCYLQMPPGERQRECTPLHVAQCFEQAHVRANIGQQLRTHVRQGGYRRIGLPGVLGLHQAPAVVAELQALSGALIFEIPTLPTSVPGLRLFHVFEQAALAAGVRMQVGGWVVRAEAEGQQLVAVYSRAAAREQRHSARRWVLATGGMLGGGLRSDAHGHIIETALGLPVAKPYSRAEWFDPLLFAPGGHPIFQAGIAVDPQLRPLDAEGRVVYENVAVVGGALAHYDELREGCREGVALATGYGEEQKNR
ncbi:glycerol-3-phosphate dehydrogenase subunit GlpB [Candidatus Viridilinea mediisalina]|uniref:Anaerobic glycerol-3-phosphate dehydrogenase subunit B n=1 Tax=Candidatus Viridilinea mediisalina TaxID=2024553 RepID=A0A2A6RN64_9CHLR|nr:glycerol-3-phosphate dehydrogenase subunit GlpB [Candidatus Viridilinea mediisalina]PDW04341.1 anaerobic glycerol-3-phosphate dehydrogenase subunit B [Candidatus Viridilinea mediisalina]